ncbi:MAG: ATP phosphoribosyltransferase [Tenuifilum sp.]|uniref:ATP phosphoribosyltransferase n=1 Tax=Tenuifilum sp. TaxID=2760880 RepID=UPI001B6C7770|nr:ATP phosphoribosyltransferase [Bacteroidales bacterium]HOK61456.1 ATP phosphoribosyltransferase [Tenuifilum sp.]HOK86776.1 ATP phosphoribosyltransferase [Tenuifilum sp.]HOU74912.1 ATP phosphoribosyltransferase [Tenuifilum sp.]HPP90973.1 ATP phosphoribosyltransferase [Tenuifilum sp.]
MNTKITLAIQKSGRLNEGTIELLNRCGIRISNGNNHLKALAEGFPMEVLLLRDDDIPQYVADGVADIGILGYNEVLEKGKDIEVIRELGFSRCRLSIAVPRDVNYSGRQWLSGKRIATSYPEILKTFLNQNAIEADIHTISGSVEITPGIGMADAIFDIVSSGGTLLSNNLKEVDVIMKSEAVLVANKSLDEQKSELLKKLEFRIEAVRKAQRNKYILLNAPKDKLNQIISLIPGMKSPTVLPLAIEGWCSLHSVVNEDDFWEVIGRLKDAGAEGILVVPIEKMVI